MSQKHKNLIVGLFVFFFLAQVIMSLTRSEFYPFSWFGIYSGRAEAEEASLPVFTLVHPDGREEAYEKWTTVPSVFRYVSNLTDQFGDAHEWAHAERKPNYEAVLKDLKASHLAYLQKHRLSPGFRSLRLSIYHWSHFTGRLALHPDRKEIVYEIPLGE